MHALLHFAVLHFAVLHFAVLRFPAYPHLFPQRGGQPLGEQSAVLHFALLHFAVLPHLSPVLVVAGGLLIYGSRFV